MEDSLSRPLLYILELTFNFSDFLGGLSLFAARLLLFVIWVLCGRWIDNIKMDLLEIGVSVVDWIGLAQDRYRWRTLVNSVMNLRVP
jgi:hypothetical protein